MKYILCILLTVANVSISYGEPAPPLESYEPGMGYSNGYNPDPPEGSWIPVGIDQQGGSNQPRRGGGFGGFGKHNPNQSNGNFGVISPECPFQEVSPGNKDILNRVENALRLLESESRNCPQAENAVKALQASLQNLQRSQSLEVFSNNPGQVNCVNYEGRLRREFDVAVSTMQGNSFDFGTVSNYSTCASTGNPGACAQQVYVRQLSQASTICKNTSKANKNQVIRDSLEQMTNTSMALIANSNSCGPKAKEAIVQTVITQVTAAASLAQGFGLIGLGINIGGRLLSALASNFLNKNSATSFLEKISAEKNRPSRFCLYYDIQKAALRCEESIYKNQSMVETANNICNADRDALSNIINLSNDIRNPLINATFKDGAEKKQYLLSQTQNFIQGLENPVDEKGKKYIDLLAEASETLATSPAPTDIAQAQELKKAVNLYNEMKQNKTADSNVLVQKLTELSSLLMGYQVDDNEARSLNLADALSRYMAIKNTGNLASTINSSRMLQQAIDHGNREAGEVVLNLKKMTDQNAIDLALSSMVSTLKPEFEQRLEELNKDYLAYRDKEKNAERHLQWLSEMLSICMSTQGMSYFPAHPNQSRLNMQEQPNKKYQQICEQFNCPNESIYVPFESKTDRYGSGSRIEKFESYQCALDRKLPLANQKLADNLKKTGKICGTK